MNAQPWEGEAPAEPAERFPSLIIRNKTSIKLYEQKIPPLLFAFIRGLNLRCRLGMATHIFIQQIPLQIGNPIRRNPAGLPASLGKLKRESMIHSPFTIFITLVKQSIDCPFHNLRSPTVASKRVIISKTHFAEEFHLRFIGLVPAHQVEGCVIPINPIDAEADRFIRL